MADSRFPPIAGGAFAEGSRPEMYHGLANEGASISVAETDGRRREAIGRRLWGLANRSSLSRLWSGAPEGPEELLGTGAR